MIFSNKIKGLALAIGLTCAMLPGRAQHLDIGFRTFPSSWYNSWFEPGNAGGGLAITWHPALNKNWRLNVGGEFALLRSRTETLFGIGAARTVWSHTFPVSDTLSAGNRGKPVPGQLRISVEANLLNGFDLFRPQGMYAGGAEAAVRCDYRISKRISAFVSFGARYTVTPGYRNYGVWRYSTWPLTVGAGF